MKLGIIKWFDDFKGIGFISPCDNSEEVFVHYSSIDDNGFKSLHVGQQVMFESIVTSKGPQATYVLRPIENEKGVYNE